MSTLYIFDFDDTLAMTNSHVRIIGKDGLLKHRLNSRAFAKYRHRPGENLDFSEFNTATGTLISDTVQEMESAISDYGVGNVFIVTARSEPRPVEMFLQSMGVSVPEVVATAGSEGKATWLTKKLLSGNYKSVKVYEDCKKNISMLRDVVEAYNEELDSAVQYSAVCILKDGSQQVMEGLVRKYVRNILYNL
tara:strand:- start:1357 stop:1932 length:576 start_codon:yes stop_codon:yes gene_type:complete